MAELPSGRQIELQSENQRAVVVEVGGGLRTYDVADWSIVEGYPAERMADGGRGQPLLPWPNRLADGSYEFGGQQHQLPIDEVARHNAIHGLTRWENWAVEDQSPDRVRLGLAVHPRPGYPFTLRLTLEYSLSGTGLTVRTSAHNAGTEPLPFGAGQHPYFSVGTPTVDSMVLGLAANTRLDLDPERCLPTGRIVRTPGTGYDFRVPRPLGALTLDACFTDLERDPDGRARVTLSDPTGQRQLVVWADEHYRYFQAFSGDTLTPERRRRGLAVEPMTCPPNAFRSGIDLIVLQPGESTALEWGVTPYF